MLPWGDFVCLLVWLYESFSFYIILCNVSVTNKLLQVAQLNRFTQCWTSDVVPLVITGELISGTPKNTAKRKKCCRCWQSECNNPSSWSLNTGIHLLALLKLHPPTHTHTHTAIGLPGSRSVSWLPGDKAMPV